MQKEVAKKPVPNTGMTDIEQLENPGEFRTKVNLGVVPKFNKHGDNIDPIIRKIPIQSIDEYLFNPRKADNDHFEDIKESIREIGLQQRFSVVKNPETGRYTLIKGGNTRLLAFKSLYRETGDTEFAAINCIVEPWEGELNRTQAVIAHLIENEARGELILVDKAKALIDLEGKYKNNEIKSLTTGQTKLEKTNIHTTIEFVVYLKNNGYSVSEKQLGLFRFTVHRLTGNLDHFLNQGMGSPQIIKIRSVYNNLKGIVKESEFDDYDLNSLNEDFSNTLKKYNKTRKPFDFEKLLDILAINFAVREPFLSLFGNNVSELKKALLSTRKPKQKEKESEESLDSQSNTNAEIEDGDGNKGTDGAEGDIGDETTIIPENNKGVNQQDNNIDPEEDNQPITPFNMEEKDVGDTNSHTDEEQEGSTSLDFYRKQAYDLVKAIAFKLNLDNTVIKINHGCGFLLVDVIDKSKSDFEGWGVWWLLLGYSHAADLLNPISDLRLLGLADIELNQDLSALYTNTSLSDTGAVDASLEKINQLSEMYEFRSTNLQSVKDRLTPFLWQDITDLEVVCYQIMRSTLSTGDGGIKLWE